MTIRNIVLGMAAVAVGFCAQADDGVKTTSTKSLESRITELEAKLKDAGVGGRVKGSGIKVSGFVDTSYLVNLADRSKTGPVSGSSAQNTGRVFDNQYDAFNLNAVKLTIQKDKDTSKFPAGFRVDTVVGEDAAIYNNTKTGYSNATMGGDNSVTLQQAYVDLGIPVGNGINARIGKTVSLVGYESADSPANWQFSRSDAFRLVPLTQNGVTLSYQWSDMFTTSTGIVNGYNNASLVNANVGALNYNTDFSFVGRVDVNGPKTKFGNFNAYVSGAVGNDDVGDNTSNDRTSHIFDLGLTMSKVGGVKPLALGYEYIYRSDEVSLGGTAGGRSLDAQSHSVYAKWDWNKWTSTSARYGLSIYDNSAPNSALSFSPLNYSGTIVSPNVEQVENFTLTQAFNVWKDTLVRLEWRHDWTSGTSGGFGPAVSGAVNDIRQEQDTIAVNVVFSF